MSKTPASETTKHDIEIDFFRSEDAPGVARLFRQVYGEGYPIRIYYLPDQLIAENAAGQIISCVARTSAGEVVGHNALILVDPATHLYENAAGAVLPTFRGQAIFSRLFKHTIVNVPKRFQVEGIIGEPVCSHVHVQKMGLELGFKESGLEIDLMPAAAYGMGPVGSGRVSVLLGTFLRKTREQAIRMPTAYREALEFLYAGLNVERTFVLSEKGLPAEGKSRGSIDLARRGAGRADLDRLALDRILAHTFPAWKGKPGKRAWSFSRSGFHSFPNMPLRRRIFCVRRDTSLAAYYRVGLTGGTACSYRKSLRNLPGRISNYTRGVPRKLEKSSNVIGGR